MNDCEVFFYMEVNTNQNESVKILGDIAELGN